ncbi:conserved exported hypothetical protein [Tenacibaculum maritimum]|uniref:hypothetical protein n=1 Tax=Tenacibaculum maritimum TaxID=107401 RepID=UPI0012E466B6|nr:hypothetical protein [Tenacibaculum maritimum]CAA0216659.1 conserved exported hypothetical protein [Tenacibaculum maritimum]
MKINTIKVAVLMALGLIGGVKGVNAQGFLYSTVESAPWGLVLRANSDNSNDEEPILFQVGQNSSSLRDFRLKVDKEESVFSTPVSIYGNLTLPGSTRVYAKYGSFRGGVSTEKEFEGLGNLTLSVKRGGIIPLGSGLGNNIYFKNQDNEEIAKLKEGALTLNKLSTIETPGSLKLQPGISNKEDDVIAFLNSENSEMARVKDGTFTVKGGNTFQSYGNLSLRANANGKQYGTIFFKDGSNREMARLERGKLTLDQISLNVTTFPDYVFAKEYHLMPLNEVASYIKENKHLPNMPTEKEVVKEGMNVGQINTLLVEKVEELTLYTIEQEEKIQAQEKTMKALLQKLEALETLVKSKK